MKTPSKRDQRLASEIRKTLTKAMNQSPPELGMITITEVFISDDWAVATIWFSVLGTHDSDVVLQWINTNQPRWKKALSELERKRVPELRFNYDKRPDVGQALENMLE
jgi:ribosome-binding factor A